MGRGVAGEHDCLDRQNAIDQFPEDVKTNPLLLSLRMAWLDAEYTSARVQDRKLADEAMAAMRLYFMARYGHPKGPLANSGMGECPARRSR